MALPNPANRTARTYEGGQRQDSLTEQMRDVIEQAEMIGAYDAADWIKRKWKLAAMAARHTDTAVDFLRSSPTGEPSDD